MGVFADDDGKFTDFARERFPETQGSDFLSRYLFGDFIQAQVADEIRSARISGYPFVVSSSSAVRMTASPDSGYRVILDDGSDLHADAAILAPGVPVPQPLACVGEESLNSGGYCVDPWRLAEWDIHPAPRRIMVLGTGLTAVDMLLSVALRWPQAEILAVSRHGRFPVTHPRLPADPYPHREQLNQALLSCDRVADMFRLFRHHLKESGADPASVVESMRPVNVPLWQKLSTRERVRFLRHLRRLWDPVRHRMPPASAWQLRELEEQGRLKVMAARIERVQGKTPLLVTLRPPGNTGPAKIEADLLVQATGLNLSVARSRNPLLLQLLEDGLIDADPLGLGYRATADFRVLDRNGEAQDKLYAIGPLLVGNFWECIAMPELRVTARQIAEALAKPH
jgi:uncharacterized NAD(P)/FAD-binding protein YdhS